MQLTKITKGAACFQCRKWKMKCDAEKPTCSRCQHRGLGCVYPTGIAKRTSLTALLEARALELEVTIQKLTLSSIHDLSLVSARLLKRVAHLGESVHRLHTPATGTAAWPQIHLRSEGIVNELIDPVQIDEDDAGGLTSVLRQDTPQSYFTSELAVGSEPSPLSPSLYLITS
ncbi:hypothetical protein DL93DRAFT_1298846 [Clavulina sp. PMI_390]|nr:hypothetical protein DL93DRAFT_1298846 [Clavulina sp. PMI_390]